MRCIDSEIILQRKISSLVYVYIMIIIVIMLSLIILFLLCYYKTYYMAKGVVINDNGNFYVRTYIPLDSLIYVTSNNVVKIKNKEYKYKIRTIDKEYFTDNITTYQIVLIEIDFESKYKFNNLTLDLSFLKEDKKIIDYIIK